MRRYRRTTSAPAAPDRSWVEQAACRGVGPGLFFSDDPFERALACRTCANCPVRTACRAYAAATPDTVGVWGGRALGYRLPT
jgi:WhiB family redox-sensing transcriptional regulator